MYFAMIPPGHVAYLRAHKGEAIAYLLTDEIKQPVGLLARLFGSSATNSTRPDDWPTGQAEEIQIDENLGTGPKAMHFFLNGTDAPVDGPSNIFQAWLLGADGSAEKFSGRDGYAFIHRPEQVAALLRLLGSLDDSSLSLRWQKLNADLSLPNEASEYQYIAECFSRLRACYESASAKGAAVIWAPQQ